MESSRSWVLILFVATAGCGSGLIHDGSGQDGTTGSAATTASAGNNAGAGAGSATGASTGGTSTSGGATGVGANTGVGGTDTGVSTAGTGASISTGIDGTGAGANTGIGSTGAGANTSTSTGGTSATPACGVDTWTNYAMTEFATRCESCHTFAGTLMGVQSQASQIKSMVSSGTMPPTSALDGNDVTRIVTWINCGLPN